jgi:hypothetical protein
LLLQESRPGTGATTRPDTSTIAPSRPPTGLSLPPSRPPTGITSPISQSRPETAISIQSPHSRPPTGKHPPELSPPRSLTDLELGLKGKLPTPQTSFWQTRKGIAIITIVVLILIGAIVGGTVGGLASKKKNSSSNNVTPSQSQPVASASNAQPISTSSAVADSQPQQTGYVPPVHTTT